MRCLLVSLLLLIASPVIAGGGGGSAMSVPGYYDFKPAFVVNLSSDEAPRFVEVEFKAYVDSKDGLAAVQRHMPVLRHETIMMLAGKPLADIDEPAEKEAWREELREHLRERLSELSGVPGISDLFFTSFIIQ